MPAPLTRRQFLTLAAVAAGSAVAVGGLVELQTVSDAAQTGTGTSHLVTSLEDLIVPTVCLLCPSGCGMLARVADDRVVKLEGNPMHPINLGSLCPKGQVALELLYNPDRLTGPLRRDGERGAGEWQPITWAEAARIVAGKLSELRADGRPERAAFLYGETRGQMRPLIEQFMAAIGSPNTVSRDSLNVEASKLATYYTQGVYDLPAYDLERSNYVLSFGASLLEAGPVPQRMISGISFLRRGRATRGKVVVIDPRQGVTGLKADEWIPIRAGTDAALALAMANVIIRSGLVDSDFVHNYGFGFEDFRDSQGKQHKGFKSFVLESYDPARAEQITGVPATTISRLAGEFAGNPPAVAILPGKGGLLNGSINGLYAGMAVHILNALVGSIEIPGGVLTQRYFPCTDWPALADDDPVAEQGRAAERVDGAGTRFPLARQAYQAVADHIIEGYPVDVLLLYDANPVYEAPGGARFADAFQKVPFIVSFSSFMDETARYADLVLPEPSFLERWQDDVVEGMGYPGVGLRQPVIEPLHDTMNTGDFLLRVAHAMGDPVAEAFPWTDFEALIQDRLQYIGTDWDTLQQLGVWAVPGYRFARRGSERWVNEVVGVDRASAPRDGRFDFFSRELFCDLGEMTQDELKAMGLTQTGDAAFVTHYEPVTYVGEEEEYPLVLNVVTLMSLGPYSAAANLPSLQEFCGMTVGEMWDSWLEMNPETARELGVRDKDAVWIESPFGRLKTTARLVEGLRRDVVNLPHNQGHTAVGRWARDRGVNGLEILNPASEPAAGLAAFTNTRVKVYPA